MNYNIFDRTAPAMPKPSKGTEFCKFLLSKASKDMREPLVPMALPALAAHLTDVKFMYSDNKYYELCGQMANLVADTGGNKGQLSLLVEAIRSNDMLCDELLSTGYKTTNKVFTPRQVQAIVDWIGAP